MAERIRAGTSPQARSAPALRGTMRSRAMRLRPAIVVAVAYLAAGTAWIVASEGILDALIPAEHTTLIQVAKGVGFVVVTSVALYLVLGSMLRELQEGTRTQASLAARLREQAQQQRLLAQRLMQAEEETRRAVAKDLHDGPLQALTLSFMRLDAASREGETAPIDATQIATAMAAIREASEEIRGVVRSLHPPLLAELGLSAAVERHCRELATRTGREIRFAGRNDGHSSVPHQVGIAVFRITQEAVANAVKHTTAGPILVELAVGASLIEVDVVDEGPGFNPEAELGTGLGLLSMRERAESVGGSIEVRSTSTGGTHVVARIPTEGVPMSGIPTGSTPAAR